MRLRIRLINILFILISLSAVSINAQEKELKLEILNGHSGGGVLAVAVSNDGKFALTGSTDNTALLWDLETGKQLRRFVGHSDAVSAVAFSKDGTQILTASYDKTARLWETATGRQTRVFVENRQGVLIGHSDKILTAAFSTDGRLVATAGEDKTARIWDAKTGTQLFLLEHDGRVNSIAFSPDSKYLLTGGENKIARLYSTKTGEVEKQFVGHNREITSVAYSPDGKQILTGSKDESVRLWNSVTTVEKVKFQLVDDEPVISDDSPFGLETQENKESRFTQENLKVVFSLNGSRIVASSQNYKVIHIWDTKSEKEIWRLNVSASSIAILPNEQQIIVTSKYDKIVLLIDIKENKKIKKLVGESDIVNSVSVSSDFKLVLIGGESNTSNIWKLINGQPSWWFGKEAFLQNKRKLESKVSQLKSEVSFENIKATDFSPDNKKFAVVDSESDVTIFTVDDLKPKQVFITEKLDISNAFSSTFSPNGKFLLVGYTPIFDDDGGLAVLWNFKDEELEKVVKHPTKIFTTSQDDVNSVAFSPDGRLFATAGNEIIQLWNFETEKVIRNIKDFLAPVWSVAFSPDGKTIATASGGEIDMLNVGIGNAMDANGVQLWDVATGEKIEGGFGGEFKSFTNKFTGFKSVAYSPDKEGRYVAAGSFDGKVWIRDNKTKQLRQFEGHTDAVNTVKFAKDANGKLLVVSGSSDSTVRIWDAATGEEICALVTFRDGNWAVMQTKTGRYDASNGGNIEGIQWTYGNEVIELGQLSSVYYTPNLLPRLLGYNNEKLSVVIPLKDIKLHPEVISQEFAANTNKLTIKLKNRNGGIGKTEVYVNDSLVVEDARSEKLKANPNLAENEIVTLEADLTGGKFGATVCEDEEKKLNCRIKDEIKVVTSNYLKEIGRGNIQSKGSVSVRTREDKKEYKLPSLYAIVAGVSDYEGDAIDLNFAAKDAEDFSNALSLGANRLFCPSQKSECLNKIDITTLSTQRNESDAQPTKENIKKAFEEIAKKATPEDIVVIYFSGHGVSFGTDSYFYLTKESNAARKEDLANDFQTGAISSDELKDWLALKEWKPGEKGIKALKQVLILDTCAAGEAAKKLTLNKELTGDQIRAIEFLKDKTGTFVLMGSTADAPSYEATQFGQGLLTYSLLQAMKGAALQNERVDVRALFDYAEKQVPQLAKNVGGIQKPIVSAPLGKTFVIGQMTDAEKNKIILPSPKPLMLRPSLGVPPINNDPSNLTPELRKRLDAESSYEVVRQRGGKEPILIYIDDDSFPDAVRVTGTYSVAGDKIKIEAYLVRGEKVLAELAEIEGAKEEVLDKLVEQIREELSKIPNVVS